MPTSPTRALIIESADLLFYEKGYAATSFADVAAEVGISRGNFYHHFKTKDDILDAVILHRIQRTREMLDAWQRDGHGPRERILSFIHMLIANRAKIMAFGCPVGTLCSELAKLDHVAQDRAAGIFALFRDWLAVQFHELGAGQRSQALALHLLSWSQGVGAIASAFRDETFIRSEVTGIEHWLASLPDISPSD